MDFNLPSNKGGMWLSDDLLQGDLKLDMTIELSIALKPVILRKVAVSVFHPPLFSQFPSLKTTR